MGLQRGSSHTQKRVATPPPWDPLGRQPAATSAHLQSIGVLNLAASALEVLQLGELGLEGGDSLDELHLGQSPVVSCRRRLHTHHHCRALAAAGGGLEGPSGDVAAESLHFVLLPLLVVPF